MGSCFSSSTSSVAKNSDEIGAPTAKVICIDGSVKKFSVVVTVSEALGIDGLSGFLCNSDSLCYDEHVHGLGPHELVKPGELYFVLPVDMLKRVLSGSDMAALAVKASHALAADALKSKSRRGNARIMPFDGEVEHDDDDEHARFNELSDGVLSLGVMKGIMTMRKSSSLRAKNGRWSSFRVKLNPIEEVAE